MRIVRVERIAVDLWDMENVLDIWSNRENEYLNPFQCHSEVGRKFFR